MACSRTVRAAAAVGLTVAPALDDPLRWWVLVPLGVFIVASEYFSDRRDHVRARDLQQVDGRLVRTIGDLGSLASGKHEIWTVEIYLPQRQWRWGFRRRLVRQRLWGLSDATWSDSDMSISDSEAVASAFKSGRRAVWWTPDLGLPPTSGDADYSTNFNERVKRICGAINVSAVARAEGGASRGVLVVRTSTDQMHATAAVGVFRSEEGRRRIAEACNDIYNALSSA